MASGKSRGLDRVQPGELQAGGLGEAAGDVHGLDAVAGGALDQVVQGGHDDHAGAAGVLLEANVAEVAADQELRLGVAVDALPLLDDSQEGLVPVLGPVDLPEIPFLHPVLYED